ncbi:MAG: glycosyltransferase family 4 protein [Acidobacteria bacterium]|nr:glycosyltransferase family 4 protein [Acidobacteriota bacterium]
MRIAIDIRKINEFGVGTYIWNLVRNISLLDDRNEYQLVGSQRKFHELGPLPSNFKQLYQADERSLWKEHISIPLMLRRQGVDIVHVPHHEPPIVVPAKLVVTVHDCVHLMFPQEDASKFANYRSYLRTKRVIQGASHIVTVSNSTKDDLISIFGVADSKISVIHNALDERFAFTHTAEERKHVLERYQLKDPFILYSGKIRPHKNLHRLIEAFAVLKSELADDERYRNLKLLIIGDELSKHQYLRLTVVRSGVQQDVRFFGFVPYPILRVFYQCASLFAFPSLYEGFGLPPLEAMANRTPVIASNTSSLPEVLEDAALLVNPENVFEIARGMKLILSDDALRQRLIQKGVEQVSKFSWKVAAQKVIATYEMTLASSADLVTA